MLAINTSTRADIQFSRASRTKSCFVSGSCCECSFLSSAQIARISARSITVASPLYAPLASRGAGCLQVRLGGQLATQAKLWARRLGACNPPALQSGLPCRHQDVRCKSGGRPATRAGRLLAGPVLSTSRIPAWDGVGANHLLIRPCEVLSRIANTAILEVANNALRVLLQHRHVLAGCLA